MQPTGDVGVNFNRGAGGREGSADASAGVFEGGGYVLDPGVKAFHALKEMGGTGLKELRIVVEIFTFVRGDYLGAFFVKGCMNGPYCYD